MSLCNGCHLLISVTDKIMCSGCQNPYHFICVNITKENFSKLSVKSKSVWKCPQCKEKKKVNDNTPVKVPEDSPKKESSPSFDKFEKRLDDFEFSLLSKLTSEIHKSIETQLKSTLDQLCKDIETISELVKSMDFLSEKFDTMHGELTELRTESSKIRAENLELREEVKSLSFKVNQMEQQARECNLDLQCLPEYTNENLFSVVTQLGKIISCPLEEKDILSCSRVAKSNRDSPRPRSVIIKLSSPRKRDELLAACLKFNKANVTDKLNSSHLGLGGDKQQIYVAEHLSPANRSLHAKARQFKKEHKFQYLWIRNGRILLKKDDTSTTIWVKNTDSLTLNVN